MPCVPLAVLGRRLLRHGADDRELFLARSVRRAASHSGSITSCERTSRPSTHHQGPSLSPVGSQAAGALSRSMRTSKRTCARTTQSATSAPGTTVSPYGPRSSRASLRRGVRSGRMCERRTRASVPASNARATTDRSRVPGHSGITSAGMPSLIKTASASSANKARRSTWNRFSVVASVALAMADVARQDERTSLRRLTRLSKSSSSSTTATTSKRGGKRAAAAARTSRRRKTSLSGCSSLAVASSPLCLLWRSSRLATTTTTD